MIPNQLMAGAQQPSASVPQSTMPQNALASQKPVPAQLPPAPPTKQQLHNAVATSKTAISSLTKIANDAAVLNSPDKLQKALLSEAADIYRASNGENDPATLISQAMSILKDPRGPKAAIQAMLSTTLYNLSVIDLHARQNHGMRLVGEPSSASPSVTDMGLASPSPQQ